MFLTSQNFKSILYKGSSFKFVVVKASSSIRLLSDGPASSLSDITEDFRVLDLKKKKTQFLPRRKPRKPVVMPPRSERMPIDQDWANVWPGPRSFHPASVPLPIRQGYPAKEGDAPPGKFANAELMKIPNFLHLTPPAIQKHCEALKRFCTPWPSSLETGADCEKHFPVEISTSDYCHSSPSIRDPLSRIVTLKVKLSNLALDEHARDKLLRLVAERYNPETDYITLLTDRCPTKKQNQDYAHFLLTALFHESWKVEDWESEKQLEDMELFDWQTSVSHESVNQLSLRLPDLDQEIVHLYGQAVTDLIDKGEDTYTVNKYKEKTKKLLSLPDEPLNQTALQ